MDVGALEPEPSDTDPDATELNAVFAATQRWTKGKGKGTGGKPGPPAAPGGPAPAGAGKGGGKGAFQGRCWKRNAVGHRAS
eukprot:1277110-Alexandrium_andersonii.AAC.1